jgi:hypothetical protein
MPLIHFFQALHEVAFVLFRVQGGYYDILAVGDDFQVCIEINIEQLQDGFFDYQSGAVPVLNQFFSHIEPPF